MIELSKREATELPFLFAHNLRKPITFTFRQTLPFR